MKYKPFSHTKRMYIDKDANGNISIMEISRQEANEIGSILLEFEYMINICSRLPDRERARMMMSSAQLRFKIGLFLI
jgi:hypothetical protein